MVDDYKYTNVYILIKRIVKDSLQRRYCLPNTSIKDNDIEKLSVEELFFELCENISRYCENLRKPGGYFSNSSKDVSLYSYFYHMMLKGLIGLDVDLKQQIGDIVADSQKSDGLLYDFNIINKEYIVGDGWGARHLMPHAIIACVREKIKLNNPLNYLSVYRNYDYMIKLLYSLDWRRVWITSNFVMNIGVMLQYSRDYCNDSEAQNGIKAIQDYLTTSIRSDIGMWFIGNKLSTAWKYEAVRGAYHLYPILLYDNIDIPYKEKAIDIILSLQNKNGGFDYRMNSSACEDIDAIEPLIRLSILTNGYRKEEVDRALKRAFVWVASNQMPDGGFVFRRGEAFNYGHKNMSSGINESNMFATWFRTLCLCYIHDYLTETKGRYVRVPGYEYPLWGEKGVNER